MKVSFNHLLKSFSRIQKKRIVVIGDLLLDTYVKGSISRISPEAPVSILRVESQSMLPGGAGNVALNLQQLGAEVSIVGRVGKDEHGQALKRLLGSSIDVQGIVEDEHYQTPVKERLIASSQQLMRVDYEQKQTPFLQTFSPVLEEKIKQADMVAISDYAKGFLTKEQLAKIFSLCKKYDVLTVVDPKGLDFTKYKGCDYIKPNEKEALQAVQKEEFPLEEIGPLLLQMTKAKGALITRSSKGILCFTQKEKEAFPSYQREVVDVTGAGDTVLSMLCLSLANDLSLQESAILSNIAASLVIQKLGCAKVTLKEVGKELVHWSAQDKVLDDDHFAIGKELLQEKDYYYLSFTQKPSFSQELFRLFALHQKYPFVLFVKEHPQKSYVFPFLSSLKQIAYIVVTKKPFSSWISKEKKEKMLFLPQKQQP